MALFIVTATLVKLRDLLLFFFFFFLSGLVTLTHPSQLWVEGWGDASVYIYIRPRCGSCIKQLMCSRAERLTTCTVRKRLHTSHTHILWHADTLRNTQPDRRWWWWWWCILPLCVVRPSRSVWFSKPRRRPATETGNSWREDRDMALVHQSIRNQWFQRRANKRH